MRWSWLPVTSVGVEEDKYTRSRLFYIRLTRKRFILLYVCKDKRPGMATPRRASGA